MICRQCVRPGPTGEWGRKTPRVVLKTGKSVPQSHPTNKTCLQNENSSNFKQTKDPVLVKKQKDQEVQ